MWFQLADRLKMSLQRCMQETTSTEFVLWQEYLQKDMSIPSREDYYAAQIATEIKRGNAKTPSAVKLEHHLLKFSLAGGPKKPLTQEEIKRRTSNSKAVWLAAMKIKPRKPPPQKDSTNGLGPRTRATCGAFSGRGFLL